MMGFRSFFILLGLLLVSTSFLNAQARDPKQMKSSTLREYAEQLIQTNKLAIGRPYFEELVRRLEADKTPGVDNTATLDSLYFYIARSFVAEYAKTKADETIDGAIQAFSTYITKYPKGLNIHYAFMNRVDAFMAKGELAKAAEDLEKILTPPLIETLPRGGLKKDALDLIVYCYYNLQDWVKGIPWFRRQIENPSSPEQRSIAVVALMQGYLSYKKVDFGKIKELIPLMGMKSSARYDISFNAALIAGADKLLDQEQVLEASFLYYLALTKEDIVEFLAERLEEQERTLRLVQVNDPKSKRISILKEDVDNSKYLLQEVKKQKTYTPELKFRQADCFKRLGRFYEAHWAYYRLAREYPDHSEIESYIYLAFDQAIRAKVHSRALEMGEFYLENEPWDRYRKQITAQLAGLYVELDDYDKFHPLADSYIRTFPNDRFSPQFVYSIGNTRVMKHGQYDVLAKQFDGYILDFPKADRILDGLYYWRAMSGIFLDDFEGSSKRFKFVLDKFPESEYREDSAFRLGVCYFGLDDFERAGRQFAEFVSFYPNSVLRGEAHVFLGDVNAQKPDVEAAIKNYDLAVEYTEKNNGKMSFITHATFQKGEVLEKNDRFKEMAKTFENYINKFRDRGDLSRAVFRLGQAKEHLGKPEEMLKDYYSAVTRFGDDPVAYGMDNILRNCVSKYYEHKKIIEDNLKFRDELIESTSFREQFFDPTPEGRNFQYTKMMEVKNLDKDFKNNVIRDKEYREKAKNDFEFQRQIFQLYEDRLDRFPKDTPEEALMKIYQDALENDEKTLAMRLMMTLERMGEDVGEIPVFTEDDFYLASPDTLVWIARKSIEESGDYDFASLALNHIFNEHSGSDSVYDALVTLGDIASEKTDYEAAFQYYQAAVANFPAHPQAAHTVIKKADMLVKHQKIDKAIEQYTQVLAVQEWKRIGAVRAKCQFKLGQVFLVKEDFEKAYRYFERTFVAYANSNDLSVWAAKSYLEAGGTLERLGRSSDAQAIYKEFMENENLQKHRDIVGEIRKRMK